MSLNNKDYGVSFARMLSMIMIISCHIFQFFGNELAYWLNSGVQIFLFISGFLYGQRLEQCDFCFLKRSFKKILVDYYICIFWCLGLHAICVREFIPLKELFKLFLCYGFGNISSVSHLWFIPIILFCYLITPMVGTIIKEQFTCINFKNVLKALCGICVLYVLLKLFFSYFIAEMVICYCFALLVGKLKTMYEDKWLGVMALLMGPIALLVNGVRIYLNYIERISLQGETMKTIYESFEQCTRVALGITLFLLFYAVYHYRLNKVKKFQRLLDLSDKYSYDVYLGHQIWILGSFSILQTNLPLLVRLILVILACVFQGVVIHKTASICVGNKK